MPKGIIEDLEPENKQSNAYFAWLKRENARQLRKAGHRAMNTKQRQKQPKSIEMQSDREIVSTKTYWEWIYENKRPNSDGEYKEPLQANPDQLSENGELND